MFVFIFRNLRAKDGFAMIYSFCDVKCFHVVLMVYHVVAIFCGADQAAMKIFHLCHCVKCCNSDKMTAVEDLYIHTHCKVKVVGC